MAERTAYNYAISIGVCETIAKEQGYDNWHLYSEDANAVLTTIGQLKNDAVFLEKNRSRHNQLSAALAKFVQFINAGRTDHTTCEQGPTKIVVPYQNKPYAEVLENHFKKGFRLESPLEIRKFRRYYSALYNTELTDADEVITDTIKRLCMVDAMVTVQTVPRIMVTAMAAGIMATIMCTAVSLVEINAAAKWTKERCGCLGK